MRDWIELTDFQVLCTVGVLPSEQETLQPLDIELKLGMDLSGAARGDLSRSIDYAAAMEQVTTLAQAGRWRLLESLAHAICRFFMIEPAPGEGRAKVGAVEVRLRKPAILGDRATPGIRLMRTGFQTYDVRDLAGGVHAEVLLESLTTAAYRVRMDAGARWRLPVGVTLHVLAGRVRVGKHTLQTGERWSEGGTASSGKEGSTTVLAIAVPPLRPRG